jgi:hypothetical protein
MEWSPFDPKRTRICIGSGVELQKHRFTLCWQPFHFTGGSHDTSAFISQIELVENETNLEVGSE